MDALAILRVLNEHTPDLTEGDEEEIWKAVDGDGDPADFAIRTCPCGQPIDGYYEYVAHLKAVFAAAGAAYVCGEDFMAGQICSLPKGHDGPHR